MSTFAFLTIYLVVALFAMSVGIALAHIKKRLTLLWGVLCLFFPPFVFVLFFLPRRKEAPAYEHESYTDKLEENDGWFN
jgi:uncharacterized membrane protein